MDVTSGDVMNERSVLVFAELIIRGWHGNRCTRDRVSGPVLAVSLSHEAVNEYSRIFHTELLESWVHYFIMLL